MADLGGRSANHYLRGAGTVQQVTIRTLSPDEAGLRRLFLASSHQFRRQSQSTASPEARAPSTKGGENYGLFTQSPRSARAFDQTRDSSVGPA